MNLEKERQVAQILKDVFGIENCSEPKAVIVSLNGNPTKVVATIIKGAIHKKALVDFETKMTQSNFKEIDYSIKRSGAYVSFRVIV